MNTAQIEFNFSRFDSKVSKRKAEAGMQQAVDHANEASKQWSERAYKFLCNYLGSGKEFMAEDLRKESQSIVPEPPSLRAWGAIIRRASKNGLIERIGYRNVSNVKAHSTPAAVWRGTF